MNLPKCDCDYPDNVTCDTCEIIINKYYFSEELQGILKLKKVGAATVCKENPVPRCSIDLVNRRSCCHDVHADG